MSRTTGIVCVIAMLAWSVPGIATADSNNNSGACAGAQSAPVDAASLEQAREALTCLVNRERTSRGLSALRPSSALAGAAIKHSDDMVAKKRFSHTGSDGSSLRTRLARAGYLRRSRAATIGETLAWGVGPYATPAQILESFLESPEHRRTLLFRRFREVGVGLVLGSPEKGLDSGVTATLDFGRR